MCIETYAIYFSAKIPGTLPSEAHRAVSGEDKAERGPHGERITFSLDPVATKKTEGLIFDDSKIKIMEATGEPEDLELFSATSFPPPPGNRKVYFFSFNG